MLVGTLLTLDTKPGRKVAAELHKQMAPLIRVKVDDRWPATSRGVVPELPGLYFVGMPFQYALTSGIVGGVGRDAENVVGHLLRTRAAQGASTRA